MAARRSSKEFLSRLEDVYGEDGSNGRKQWDSGWTQEQFQEDLEETKDKKYRATLQSAREAERRRQQEYRESQS